MVASRISIGKAGSRKVYFDAERRSTHLQVVGGTGAGKTKFLEHMIRQDILKGHGVCLIDPHGEVFDSIVDFCTSIEADSFCNIHIIDPSIEDWRVGLNPLACRHGESPVMRVENALEVFGSVWGGENSYQTPSIRTSLRAIMDALIAHGRTLADALTLTNRLDDNQIRAFLIATSTNPVMKQVWKNYDDAAKNVRDFEAEIGGSRRRLIEVLHDDFFREMFGQVEHALDFRAIMDKGDVVLVNLSTRGSLDYARARTIGTFLVREMIQVAMTRDIDHAKEHPFYLYIDECSRFLTNDIEIMLAETRKFGLHAILAHQWLAQLNRTDPLIYEAVMSIQNKVIFGGLKDADAEILAKELFRTEYDIEIPVESLIRPTVVEYRRTWLDNWSESESSSESETSSSSSSESDTSGETQDYDDDGFPSGSPSTSISENIGTSSSSSSSSSTSRSSSRGSSETFEPILEDRVTAVHGMDKVQHLAIARLRSLPARNAVVKGTGTPSFDIRTFDVEKKTVHPESRINFIERVMKNSPYAIPTARAHVLIDLQTKAFVDKITQWRDTPTDDEETPDEWRG